MKPKLTTVPQHHNARYPNPELPTEMVDVLVFAPRAKLDLFGRIIDTTVDNYILTAIVPVLHTEYSPNLLEVNLRWQAVPMPHRYQQMNFCDFVKLCQLKMETDNTIAHYRMRFPYWEFLQKFGPKKVEDATT